MRLRASLFGTETKESLDLQRFFSSFFFYLASSPLEVSTVRSGLWKAFVLSCHSSCGSQKSYRLALAFAPGYCTSLLKGSRLF